MPFLTCGMATCYNSPQGQSLITGFGEVSERLIEQPWKGCVGFIPTVGSNPTLSGL